VTGLVLPGHFVPPPGGVFLKSTRCECPHVVSLGPVELVVPLRDVLNMRSRFWCFTLNSPRGLLHPDVDGYDRLQVSYLIYQEEVGESGTYHFQGYLEFACRKTLSVCTTLPGLEGAHFEVRRGSQSEAIAYASKAETQLAGPYVYGAPTVSEQGKRSDLLAVKAAVDAGASLTQLYESHFGSMVRSSRGVMQYKRLVTAPRTFESIVFLFCGPSGVGKSTLAILIAKSLGSVYYVPCRKGSGLYFDDYDGQDVLFFDEFDGSTMSATDFNRLCQPFPYTLPTHGGAGAQLVSRYIFITSNYHPSVWWKNRTPSQVYQTMRRIHAPIYRVLPPPAWAVYKRQARTYAPFGGSTAPPPPAVIAVSHDKQSSISFKAPYPEGSEIIELL